MIHICPSLRPDRRLWLLAVIPFCVLTRIEAAVNPELLRQEAQASATDVAILEITAKSASGQPPGNVVELDAVVIEVKRSAGTLQAGQAIDIAFSTVSPVDPDFEASRPGRQPPISPRTPEVG